RTYKHRAVIPHRVFFQSCWLPLSSICDLRPKNTFYPRGGPGYPTVTRVGMAGKSTQRLVNPCEVSIEGYQRWLMS
ncbi:MAG: hypothetical protein ACYTBZ_10755, partial [Planctomycetota bacterium]